MRFSRQVSLGNLGVILVVILFVLVPLSTVKAAAPLIRNIQACNTGNCAGSASVEDGNTDPTVWPIFAQTLYISPITESVNLRISPSISSSIMGVVYAGEQIEVAEPFSQALEKIGVREEWVHIRTADGQSGYTAAWLYDVAQVVAQPTTVLVDSPASAPSKSVEQIYLTPNGDGIRVRAEPVDGSVVAVLTLGDLVEVMEPIEDALSKIGVYNEWVLVRNRDGVEGYTAAWLYTVANVVQPAQPATSQIVLVSSEPLMSSPRQSESPLYLTPQGDGINVRTSPVSGTVVDTVALGERVEVIEPVEGAVSKIGARDQWVMVRTARGQEGYTAAWLYDAVAEETTDNSLVATAPAAIPPLPASDAMGQGDVTSVGPKTLPVNSITELNVFPASMGMPESIPPMVNSIQTLGVLENSKYAEAPVVPSPAPVTNNPVVAAPKTGGLAAPSLDLVNNIVPITVHVTDGKGIDIAELSVNGYQLATFTQEPYTYNLDASLLGEGNYRLTFTAVRPDGIVHSADLYFQVVIEEAAAAAFDASPFTASTTGSVPGPLVNSFETNAVPAADAQRVLLLNGQETPFDLDFSAENGLVPVAQKQTVASASGVESPKDSPSLKRILSKPFNSIIPAPVLDMLTVQRPTVSAVIIWAMLLLLVPQGLFTLYWMMYTWNNPEVAEAYRSPKEFTEPRYSFTALLPARHEEKVIKDTIRAVDRINYPDELKEILVLIRDEDDDATIAAANDAIWEIGKTNIRLVTFTDGPRNKPNGLNKGLRAATKDVVCVFDAEDEPHPDIYNVVNTVMLRDNADVVQSGVQLMNFRSSWFAVFTVLEYFFWFKSGLHAFTRKFNVTPLGGNTVFFKRQWLERLRGWDESCLTEDADVGLRLTQMGAKIQIVYDETHATQEETPDTVESFIKQRTRWNQGFYQIFFKGDWMKLPSLKQKIVALYILLNSLLQAAMIIYMPIGLYIALTQDVPVILAIVSYIPIYLLLIQLVTSLIGIREFTSAYGEKLPMFFTLRMIVYYYPYQLLLSFAAIRAVSRTVLQQRGWEKTAHANLHRQGQIKEARL